jgi:predicted small metal-binding protein
MLQLACESCSAVFTAESDREILVAAVDHAGHEHGMADSPAQAAVQALDNIVEAA